MLSPKETLDIASLAQIKVPLKQKSFYKLIQERLVSSTDYPQCIVICEDGRIGEFKWFRYGEPGADGMSGRVAWIGQVGTDAVDGLFYKVRK